VVVSLNERFVQAPILQSILVLVAIVVGIFIVLPIVIVWYKVKRQKMRLHL
jgi:hypothetical protein